MNAITLLCFKTISLQFIYDLYVLKNASVFVFLVYQIVSEFVRLLTFKLYILEHYGRSTSYEFKNNYQNRAKY